MEQHIFFSEPGLKIVLNPHIVGDELFNLAIECSIDFLKTLPKKVFQNQPITLLNILRGGRYYGVSEAWKKVFPNPTKHPHLNLSEIRAARYLDPADNNRWKCKVWFDKNVASITEEESYTNLLKARTLIIGDTIATGSTLKNVLEWVTSLRKQHNVC